MSSPEGGDKLDQEMAFLKEQGVTCLVSLLMQDETSHYGLDRESECAREQGIEPISFEIQDKMAPSSIMKSCQFVTDLWRKVQEGQSIALHCRKGVGRTGMIAAGVLVAGGEEPLKAVYRVSKAREWGVPDTDVQRIWIGYIFELIKTGCYKGT